MSELKSLRSVGDRLNSICAAEQPFVNAEPSPAPQNNNIISKTEAPENLSTHSGAERFSGEYLFKYFFQLVKSIICGRREGSRLLAYGGILVLAHGVIGKKLHRSVTSVRIEECF